MKIIAIIIAKIIIFFGNILKRGSSLPGKIALKIDHNLLKKLHYPTTRIIVTGSSGKGTTSSLIANTLKKTGAKVCFNNMGSNLAWGITTSLIRSSTIFGRITSNYLVLEIDERYTKDIFPALKPTHLVITNLTKDQPPRQHDIDLVYADIKKNLSPKTKIITTIDEPYLRKFALDLSTDPVYYSIAKNKYSYKNQIFENLNTYFCPICNTRLNYQYYNFETLGNYSCPNCSFKYEKPDYLGQALDLETETITINSKEVLIGGDMLYNAYNTMSAFATLKELNLDEDLIISSLNTLNQKEPKKFTINNILYYPISCKAENATTYNQAVFKVMHDSNPKDIIIGWKEISRRYNHFDISWLYDIEFELLNNKSLNKIYACGIDKNNIKKRLILSGIPENKIITSDDIPSIKPSVLNDNVNVYGILNFDYIEPFNNTFKDFDKEAKK